MIEIAIIIHDGEKIIDEYQSLINPERPIQPFISKLTGISNGMVRNEPTFSEVADEVFEMLKGHVFVAHNVKFDYGFLKASFKANQITFRSDHICTVELSRKVFLNQSSYSLGKLCQSIGIPVSNRHRAFGDTEATARLFEKIWNTDRQKIFEEIRSDEINPDYFPQGFNVDDLDNVPETVGLYRFYDEDDSIIYVSKTKNLRNGILAHFKQEFSQNKYKWIQKLKRFDFEEMPSEMSALMLENKEVVLFKPIGNKNIKPIKNKAGVYLRRDIEGYTDIVVSDINKEEDTPFFKFTSVIKGTKYIQQLYKKIDLSSTDKKHLSVDKYNHIVFNLVQSITYPFQNCWIIESKPYQELSVIYIVKNYELQGYALVDDPKYVDYDEVYDVKVDVVETSELRRFFLQFIRQKKASLNIIDLGVNGDV
ncbi:MAG: exonuclease domain-containing protein [Chitinophagales bacterium]|nr:exonuclease domain-containing protein [Chitinophagales bacterium]